MKSGIDGDKSLRFIFLLIRKQSGVPFSVMQGLFF